MPSSTRARKGQAFMKGNSGSFFAWSDSMRVGIPLLDEDHEIIIRLNIRLQEGLERRDDAQVLTTICRRLIVFNEFHFRREEIMMEACGYPHLRGHRAEHTRFLEGFQLFMDRYAAQPDRIILREIVSYLREWVQQHVLIDDAFMGTHLARKHFSCAHEAAQTFGRLEVR